jgi:hypothetical protein
MDEETQAQQPQLSISDLQNLRAVVDLAVKRGAFGAAEASSVGAVFDRLNTFLEALAATQPQQGETAGETPAAQ